MTAALLMTARVGCDARLAQAARLYADAGYAVDLVLAIDDEPTQHLPITPRRLAVGQRAVVSNLAARLHWEDPLSIVHVDAPALPGLSVPVVGDGLRIVDHKDAAGSDWRPAGEVDLVLTSSEDTRQQLRAGGAPAMRLPMELAPPARLRLDRTDRVGWFGPWDTVLAHGWRDVMTALRDQATLLPRAALVGGPGVEGAELDNGCSAVQLIKRPRAGVEGFRACDVALMPAVSAEGQGASILAALSRGCPVLMLESAAAPFEDRWHLPTAATIADLARLLGRALTGDSAERIWLARGLQDTIAALQRDQAAMERHIMSEISAMAAAI